MTIGRQCIQQLCPKSPVLGLIPGAVAAAPVVAALLLL